MRESNLNVLTIAHSSRSPSVASNRESMVSLGVPDDLTPVAEQNPAIGEVNHDFL